MKEKKTIRSQGHFCEQTDKLLTRVGLPHINDRGARRRISKTHPKWTKIVFRGRGPDSFWGTNNSKNISYLRKYTYGLVIFLER